MPANVLSIAGVDPSGGAGVLADLKAFSALGAYGCAVICALTAQNTRTVNGVSMVEPAFIRDQLNTLFDDVAIDAIKVGMLGSSAVIETVAARLEAIAPNVPIVLDPVMVAKSGDALLAPDAVAALREQLLPLAHIITPNLPEAGELLGQKPPQNIVEMRRVIEQLRRLLPKQSAWVLLKGGHLDGDTAHDLLFDGNTLIELATPRIETKNTHGTGCTLSSAIAALLPQRIDTPAAVADAKTYLTEAIKQSGRLTVGTGHGPVHHFHQWWS